MFLKDALSNAKLRLERQKKKINIYNLLSNSSDEDFQIDPE